VTVLVSTNSLFFILARAPRKTRGFGSRRAENPGLFARPCTEFRDSSPAPDTRAGMTSATALQRNRCNYLLQCSTIAISSAIFPTTLLSRNNTGVLVRNTLHQGRREYQRRLDNVDHVCVSPPIVDLPRLRDQLWYGSCP
jgi:hypothetical protein